MNTYVIGIGMQEKARTRVHFSPVWSGQFLFWTFGQFILVLHFQLNSLFAICKLRFVGVWEFDYIMEWDMK